MNVITSTDAPVLMSAMTPTVVGLEELRDDVRVAHWALSMARLELPVVWRYRGDDAISFRRELARRIHRGLVGVRKAEQALAEAQAVAALRRAREAQPATLTAQQIGLCIKDLGNIVAWLDRLSLAKPADFDFHAKLLMRDRAEWVRDLLLGAVVQPISIATN